MSLVRERGAVLATDFGRTGRTWFIPRALHLCQRTEYGFICMCSTWGGTSKDGRTKELARQHYCTQALGTVCKWSMLYFVWKWSWLVVGPVAHSESKCWPFLWWGSNIQMASSVPSGTHQLWDMGLSGAFVFLSRREGREMNAYRHEERRIISGPLFWCSIFWHRVKFIAYFSYCLGKKELINYNSAP